MKTSITLKEFLSASLAYNDNRKLPFFQNLPLDGAYAYRNTFDINNMLKNLKYMDTYATIMDLEYMSWNTQLDRPNMNELASKLIYTLIPKYYTSYCITAPLDEDSLGKEWLPYFHRLLNKIFSVLTATYPYYKEIFYYYEAKEQKLLDAVKMSSTTASEGNTTSNASGTSSSSGNDTTTFNTTDRTDREVEEGGSDSSKIQYNSQIRLVVDGESNGTSKNKLKDTPQASIVDSDSFNSQVVDTISHQEDDRVDTTNKSGDDTTTNTYGKTMSEGVSFHKTGTEGISKATSQTDSHTQSSTDASSAESEILDDKLTPIERLKEIQEAYKRVMRDWVNEFKGIFWEAWE